MRKLKKRIWKLINNNSCVIYYLLALLSGASLVFSFAPFGYWLITPIALSLFFFCIDKTSTNKEAFKVGFSFGMGWFAAGIHWVHVSIDQYGGLPLIFSLLLMLLLCAYLSLFPALFGWVAKRWFGKVNCLFLLPLLWGLTEFLRSWVLTGFPWLSLGYGQIDSPLANWATLIGEAGIGIILIATGWCLYQLLAKKDWRFLLPIVPFYISGPFISHQTDKGKSIEVTLVQGNIAQSMRWVPEQDWPTMEKYLDLTQPYWQSDLIIWPEAAVPKVEPLAQEYLSYLDAMASDNNTALITGIADYKIVSQHAYNNLIVVGKKSAADENGHYGYGHSNRYSKYHLLPIGEFIPLENWIRGLAPIFDLPMSSFSRGDYQQQNLVANDIQIAANICFEILFPQQLLDNLQSDTDLMLTVSNDAWFGASIGPKQHMEIARMRALELGLPVLRATNNGITGIISVEGRIQAVAEQFTDAVLHESINLDKINTPFKQSNGMSYWLVLLFLFLASIVSGKKNRSQGSDFTLFNN